MSIHSTDRNFNINSDINFNLNTIKNIIAKARLQGRSTLFETEGMEILEAAGLRTARRIFLKSPTDFQPQLLREFDGTKVVLKAVSAQILHKTELGAVKIIDIDCTEASTTLANELRAMDQHLRQIAPSTLIEGYTLSECIPFEKSFGHELLLGFRHTEDFGPVVTVGIGGVSTEFLSSQMSPGKEMAILSPSLCRNETAIINALKEVAIVRMATQSWRGQAPWLELKSLVDACKILLQLASHLANNQQSDLNFEISEFEINPMVIAKSPQSQLVALDALVKLRERKPPDQAPHPNLLPRPIHKIKNLLEPKSIALVGVSESKKDRPSPGRVILENLIKVGYPRESLSIIKPGSETIEGCQCFADFSKIQHKQDLVVLAVAAAQVPSFVQELIETKKAESIIVIPGGLEEKAGTEAIVAQMNSTLEQSRSAALNQEDQGPVLNGGNCLGVRSRPGKVNTLFIPEYKLPLVTDKETPLAFISQSGAFAISRLNKLSTLNPKFVVTLGNQMDLTISDYLHYLKSDQELEVFAVYVEGFKSYDGLRFLEATRELTRAGKQVILYRAGRTEAGAQASASHTASIAGNYGVTRALCRQAGAVLAETLTEFEDLTRLACALRSKNTLTEKPRLAALSNAGFECVTFADHLGPMTLAVLSPDTNQRLTTIFAQARIQQIVDLHNPLDLTPMCADAEYERVVATLLAAREVDALIVGCVPLTPALQTLPPAQPESNPGVEPQLNLNSSLKDVCYTEDMNRESALANRLVRLWNSNEPWATKPWVVVVDAGALYDPFVNLLEQGGIPVFRSAERALTTLTKLLGRS